MSLNLISTADLHIHIRKDVPKAWQIQRYIKLFDTLVNLCYEHAAELSVSGDLLDSVEPSVEEIELFLIFMSQLRAAGIPVWLTSGNHETISTGRSVLDHLMKAGYDNVTYKPSHSIKHQGVCLHLINHDDLSGDRFPIEPDTINVLLSHMRCNVNQFIREEIDVEVFCEPYDLVILGDIHEKLKLSDKIWYTNNPVNQQFERKPQCGVLLVKLESTTKACVVTRVETSDLPQLVQRTCTAAEWPPEFNDTDYFRVEVEGTPSELREVKCDLPNVKLDRIPLVSEVIATVEQVSQLAEVESSGADTEEEMQNYMIAMKHPEEHVASMMSLYREVMA